MTDQNPNTTAHTSQGVPLNTPDITTDIATGIDANINNEASTDDAPETNFKPVSIMVYGKAYTVNCPEGEEARLKQGGKEINKFVQDVRRQAPSLSREELLLLCCLDMYESLEQMKNKEKSNKEYEQQALDLVNKILADAESML